MRRDIEQLAGGTFDVAIIGGGIHGAWIALRAQRAGLRVALIEKGDFGAATSANSLKILHGGLRYLQHLDLPRMRRSIAARREFGRLSPQLVRPLPCVMPLQAAGIRSPWILGPALLANEVMSMDRNSGVSQPAQLPAGQLLSKAQARSLIAPLANVDAVAGAKWFDAISLHAGRLVLEPLMLAAQGGAVIANRVEALRFLSRQQAVCGVIARDLRSGREIDIKAAAVVDASGPWAGQLSVAQGLPSGFLPASWLLGVNLMFRRSLGIETAVALTSSSKSADASALLHRSGRELFYVPWAGVTMVGTDYHEVPTLQDARGPTMQMIEPFLAEAAGIAPRAELTLDDVALVHWGLLPAAAGSAQVPLKAPILAAHRYETGLDGLVILMSEKLTSAPMLSLKVLEKVSQKVKAASSSVDSIAMDHGRAPVTDDESVLAQRYGSSWRQALQLLHDQPELAQSIGHGVAVQRLEIVHAIRNEMAGSLEDVVLRRLSIAQTGHPGTQTLQACASLVAAELKIDAADMDAQVTALERWFTARGLPH
jgi:glycerol-3-phosphate dehydrogenase